LAMRFSSEIFTPDEQTVSQRWQPMQSSIHSSTEGLSGLRNLSAPGPACFGPGNCGDTRETGQMAVQVAQRIQTSELFLGQISLCIPVIQHSLDQKGLSKNPKSEYLNPNSGFSASDLRRCLI
jgi:hypothetical protein